MPKKSSCLDSVGESNKEILFDILAREGVETVNVTFDGSGDDGQIEGSDLPEKIGEIVVKGSKTRHGTIWEDGKSKIKWKNDCTVDEIIEGLCYDALENLHDGWEINDGAYGQFVFDVKKRKIHFEYNERYVESKLYEYLI